ncbi:MAG: hypothetical protein EAZ57_09480 [Cytophagales bacterium]|nr:MAG: hypothetical protein EAZ67_01490 [Cytophagales bacterium]TAF59869.1 MAG: hypothetical protein EAZ57_09480 [Cytophagales bacterium]
MKHTALKLFIWGFALTMSLWYGQNVFSQSKSPNKSFCSFSNVVASPNIIEEGVEGILVKGVLNMNQTPKAIKDSLKQNPEQALDMSLAFTTYVWASGHNFKHNLGTHTVSLSVSEDAKQVTWRQHLPYAFLGVMYGSQIFTVDVKAVVQDSVLAYVSGQKATSKVPEMGFYDLELTSLSVSGSEWDISGVGFSLSRGGVYKKTEDKAPDTYVIAGLNGFKLNKTETYTNTSTLENIPVFVQKVIGIGNRISVATYDQDTFIHDKIGDYQLQTSQEPEKEHKFTTKNSTATFRLRYKGLKKAEMYIKNFENNPEKKQISFEVVHKSAGFAKYVYEVRESAKMYVLSEIFFDMPNPQKLDEKSQRVVLNYNHLMQNGSAPMPTELFINSATAASNGFSIRLK